MVWSFFFLMIRRPPRSTLDRSSAASDVYKRQNEARLNGAPKRATVAPQQDEMDLREDQWQQQ